jgi:acyl-homoserine lactone acylase PvdQ
VRVMMVFKIKSVVIVMLVVISPFSGNYIFPPGQDGNMFSFYYDNWLTPWSKGEYLAAHMAQWPTDRTLTVEPRK